MLASRLVMSYEGSTVERSQFASARVLVCLCKWEVGWTSGMLYIKKCCYRMTKYLRAYFTNAIGLLAFIFVTNSFFCKAALAYLSQVKLPLGAKASYSH
jgi:hypothetical protein